MKILIAPAHYLFSDQVGSEPLWAVELVQALSTQIDEIDVIVGVNECVRPLPQNVHIHSLFSHRSTSPWTEFLRKLLFYFLVTLKGLQLIHRNRYQVVHHVLPFSLASFNPLLIVCKWLDPRVKTIIGPVQAPYAQSNVRDVDLVLVGKKSNRMTMLPLEIVILILSRFLSWPTRYLISAVDYLVCTSRVSAQYYGKFRRKSVKIIPPLIKPVVSEISPDRGEPWRILYVGSLVERKGVTDLLQAISILLRHSCPVLLNIVGDGPLRDQLQKETAKLGINEQVTFSGNVARDSIGGYYRTSHLVCIPSLEDSYPTVIIESLSAGLPVVATRVGSASEMVGSGGLVVARHNPEKLAAAMEKIISGSKTYSEFHRESLKQYNRYYSLPVVSRAYLQIYS